MIQLNIILPSMPESPKCSLSPGHIPAALPIFKLIFKFKWYKTCNMLKLSHRQVFYHTQNYPSKLSFKMTLQKFPSKSSLRIILQNHPSESSFKSILQYYPSKLFSKIILQNYPPKLSFKISLQKYLPKLSFKIILHCCKQMAITSIQVPRTYQNQCVLDTKLYAI